MPTDEETENEPAQGSSKPSSRAPKPGTEDPPAKKRRRVEEEEPTPVIGGRFLIAAVTIGVLTLIPLSSIGSVLEPSDPPGSDVSQWKAGQTSTVRITLVTADYNLLSCASPQAFGDKHCAYKSETEAWPREPGAPLDDNKVNIIQPYRTWLDNRLILVAGLWAQPELAMRVHNEPSAGVLSEKLARFATECSLKFVGQMDKPNLRWAPNQAWGSEQPTMVAVAENCKIIVEPSADCPEGAVCALMRLF